VRSYVLPDFVPTSSNKLGYVRFPPTGNTPPASPNAEDEDMEPEEVRYDGKGKGKAKVVEEEQVLQMSNERFTVPECLFNPSSIGESIALLV
jgi:actin-related protein 6